jgi:HD-GYP domain-containing protein (c-di-GMP phosphodiesterase class II)
MSQGNFLFYYLGKEDPEPIREVCKILKKDFFLEKLEKEVDLFSVLYNKEVKGLFIDYEIYQAKISELQPVLLKETLAPLAIVLTFNWKPSVNEEILSNPYIFDYLEYPFDKKRLAFTINKLATYLNSRKEAYQLDERLQLRSKEVQELNAIGIALSAQRDVDKLMELILKKIREITSADAGTLYLVEEKEGVQADETNYFANKQMRFKLTQNDTKTIPFRESTMAINEKSIGGYVALTGVPLNIDDVYILPPDSKFSFNMSFDRTYTYRTKSMLVIPMKDHKDRIIGVIQLINKKNHWNARLDSREAIESEIISFDKRDEELAYSIASQAAVSLENARLYEDIKKLFEGFIKASVKAIESRDPTTSGHSGRVALLTVGLAEEVDRITVGPYSSIKFSIEDIQEIRYASLLHDFGKIGVRENVLLKARKLQDYEIEVIKNRFNVLKKCVELKYWKEKVDYLLRKDKTEAIEILKKIDDQLRQQLDEFDEYFKFIIAVNEPTVLVENVECEKLQKLSALIVEGYDGESLPLVMDNEIKSLSISRGSLSFEEREEIESHVQHTYNFLSQIPWTSDLKQVPDIAYSHHEKLNGTGYPRKLTAERIPIQAQMMTISDIYDALTSRDRPYKRAVAPEKALDILQGDVDAQKIDAELFNIFVETRVYQRIKKE